LAGNRIRKKEAPTQATANSLSFLSLAFSRRNSSIFCGSVQFIQSLSVMV
jgi:hypothetical protein